MKEHKMQTLNQKTKLLNLNTRLKKLQDKIYNEAINLDKQLLKRVADKNDILYDYEIEIDITFYLKENDKNYYEDKDNIVTTINEYLKKCSIKDKSMQHRLNTNHNDFRACKDDLMYGENHCWWFHSLYEHKEIDFEDMLKIGDIRANIKVQYQYIDKKVKL